MNTLRGHLDFNKFISSISLALDLAESCVFKDYVQIGQDSKSFADLDVNKHNFSSHSKKTALVAMHIANRLGIKENKLNNLYIAAFLHDIGAVDATSDFSHTNSDFLYEHSRYGADIIKNLPVDESVSTFIKLHHESYDGKGPFALHAHETPLEAQIIHLADFFELVYDNEIGHIQRDMVLNWFAARKGKMFDPYLVDELLALGETERFWLDLENIDRDLGVLERIRPKIFAPVDLPQLSNISTVFASIIDKKSSFTHQHSSDLAANTCKISSLYGFDEEKTERLKIAGHLHDLGKLAVPNRILDKPGKLTVDEYRLVKAHTYYTKLVLDKIDTIGDICEWASNHHETLNGKGYPEGLSSDSLCLESRILSVCDIYQALIENRPYRPGLSKSKAISVIDGMVEHGNLDPSVVKKLKDIV